MDRIELNRVAVLRSLLKRGVVKFIYKDTSINNVCSYGTANQGLIESHNIPYEYKADPSKDFIADNERVGEIMFFDFVKNQWHYVAEEDVVAVDTNVSTDMAWTRQNPEDGRHLAWCCDGDEMYLTWCRYTDSNDCVADSEGYPREADQIILSKIRSADKAVRDVALYQLYLAFARPIIHINVVNRMTTIRPHSVADIINDMLAGKHGKDMI